MATPSAMMKTSAPGRWSLGPGALSASVDNVASQDENSDEVEQEDEGKPPHPPEPVWTNFSEFHECEVEGDRERYPDDSAGNALQEEKDHPFIVRDADARFKLELPIMLARCL